VGLARNPRAFAGINTVHTTTKEEAIQLCKLAIQQREGTEIEAVILQQVGTISNAHLLSFYLLFRTIFFWHEFLC
jgi:hypothetical protein